MSFLGRNNTANTLKVMVLPLLLAVFPAFFLYGNNVTKLLLSSLGRTVILYSLIAVLFFALTWIAFRGQSMKAANAVFVFLIFFNSYGVVYSFLVGQDWFQVEHYTFLPFFLLLALYASWIATGVNPNSFWSTAMIIMVSLIVFNLFKIITGEIEKEQLSNLGETASPIVSDVNSETNYPDIYFVIFDEFAGFDSMRSYWNYQEVDDFIEFVESKGFYVAENSRSSSLATFHQLAERLNYKEYPIVDRDDVNVYFNDIYNNRAMQYLKSKGYTTIVFEETDHFFGGFAQLEADYLFGYDANKMADLGILFDDFGILVADSTMLRAFSNRYKILDPTLEQHRAWINFVTEKAGNLDEIPAPRFIYIHFILPHAPFLFDENGNQIDPAFHYNWEYYLGNYKYSIKIAERMINTIFSNADPNNPPIVIIQSDHGARNGSAAVSGSKVFEDFPDEYKYDIMNIMYIPGYDTSQLQKDMKPINTLPVIFNYVFDAKIPLK